MEIPPLSSLSPLPCLLPGALGQGQEVQGRALPLGFGGRLSVQAFQGDAKDSEWQSLTHPTLPPLHPQVRAKKLAKYVLQILKLMV